jgi:uncharacterized membrane protein
MAEDSSNLLAIAAMAAVTLACRCGGYLVFSRVRPTPFIRNAMAHLPGCIFVSYVVPRLLTGSPATWIGAIATILTMLLSRNLGASIAAGIGATWAATALL